MREMCKKCGGTGEICPSGPSDAPMNPCDLCAVAAPMPDNSPISQERLEAIARGENSLRGETFRMARELLARRDWARAANQFMWAHEHDCPRRTDGVCNCGLDTFLSRPRDFVESYKAELLALREDRARLAKALQQFPPRRSRKMQL